MSLSMSMAVEKEKDHRSPSNPSSSVIAPSDPRVLALHNILANMPSANLENVLSSCGIDPIAELVEAVLPLSYSFPSAAVHFFRWAGLSIKHTPNSWNLIVDILGKNSLFELMWDTIHSMKKESSALSLTTFSSVFSSYYSRGQFKQPSGYQKIMKSRNCAPGIEFFTSALEILMKKRDLANASVLWDIMLMDLGIVPDLRMYHFMVVLCCKNININFAYKLLDEMPFNGVFPDSAIYGAIFDCLVRMKNAREAEKLFAEMSKNEQVPSASSCASAIRMFFKEFNPMAAREVWRCVVEERVSPAEDCAQEVIRGFSDLNQWSGMECYIEEMLNMGIELPSNIIEKLKTGKNDWYERIAKRLKPLH